MIQKLLMAASQETEVLTRKQLIRIVLGKDYIAGLEKALSQKDEDDLRNQLVLSCISL